MSAMTAHVEADAPRLRRSRRVGWIELLQFLAQYGLLAGLVAGYLLDV